MKYSIVIPTYNHCDSFLKPCVESIFKHTDMTDVELVISANGCTDNTWHYLNDLALQFNSIGFGDHLKVAWSDEPLGFPQAVNTGIQITTGKRIILLNNDTVLLDQPKNYWLNMLESPLLLNPKCGISGPVKQRSPETDRMFVIFFCAMIDRKVFDKIGLLNTEYGIGGGEDIEFCIEAEMAGFETAECVPRFAEQGKLHIGGFPIYHAAEATMLNENLVPNWHATYLTNELKLARKYNVEKYKDVLRNNFERHLSLNGELVPTREAARYKWAANNLVGTRVLEIGCSNGYGSQFLPEYTIYTGIDYDQRIVEVAKQEQWGITRSFEWADINTYDLQQYDTIIAFEVIEHLDNGLDIVEKLKRHCKRLLISVPYKEPPGYWGEHHKLHMLDQSHLPGFKYYFCDEIGNIADTPIESSPFNLMLCLYDAE